MPERRGLLTNGITAEQFQNMDQGERDWHVYSRIDIMANHVSDIKGDVGMLKQFRMHLIVGGLITLGFMCGIGLLNWQTVVKFAPKLLML